jgi:flagellar assembly protein FliH
MPLSNIIKANRVHLLEGQPATPAAPAQPPPEPTIEEEHVLLSVPEMEGREEEDVGAAYDELLAAAQEEVGRLLEDARIEAADLKAQTEEECEALRAKAEEEGYESGLASAQAEAAQSIEEAQAQAQEYLESAKQLRDDVLEDAREEILSLAVLIAEKILYQTITDDSGAFMSLVEHAVAQARTEGDLRLHVAPQQFTEVFQKKTKVGIQTPDGTVNAAVTQDSVLKPGDLLLETGSGVIDAGIHSQLERMSHGLGIPDEEEA